jgi:hypothetical protein
MIAFLNAAMAIGRQALRDLKEHCAPKNDQANTNKMPRIR